jgi:hypothetical protein
MLDTMTSELSPPRRATRQLTLRLRTLLVALVAVALASAGVTIGAIEAAGGSLGSRPAAATRTNVPIITRLTVTPPAGWQTQTLTTAQRNAGILLAVDRHGPSAGFIVRTVVGRLAPNFSLPSLQSDTLHALQGQVKGLTVLGSGTGKLGAFDSVRILYRAPSAAGGQDETLLIIVPQPQQSYYLILTSAQADFGKVLPGGVGLLSQVAALI